MAKQKRGGKKRYPNKQTQTSTKQQVSAPKPKKAELLEKPMAEKEEKISWWRRFLNFFTRKKKSQPDDIDNNEVSEPLIAITNSMTSENSSTTTLMSDSSESHNATDTEAPLEVSSTKADAQEQTNDDNINCNNEEEDDKEGNMMLEVTEKSNDFDKFTDFYKKHIEKTGNDSDSIPSRIIEHSKEKKEYANTTEVKQAINIKPVDEIPEVVEPSEQKPVEEKQKDNKIIEKLQKLSEKYGATGLGGSNANESEALLATTDYLEQVLKERKELKERITAIEAHNTNYVKAEQEKRENENEIKQKMFSFMSPETQNNYNNKTVKELVTELVERFLALQQQINKNKQEAEATISEQKEKITQLSENAERLNSQIAEHQATIGALNASDVGILSEKKATLETQLKEQNAQSAKIQRELDKATEELNTIREDYDKLKEQKDALKEQFDKLKEDKNELSKQCGIVRRELATAENKLETVNNEKDNLKADLENKNSEYIALDELNKDLEREKKDVQDKLGKTEEKLQKEEQKNHLLSSELKSATSIIEEETKRKKQQFIQGIGAITSLLEKGGYILGCSEDNSEAQAFESAIAESAEVFQENLPEVNAVTPSEAYCKIQELLANELQKADGWMGRLARFYAYSRLAFMTDTKKDIGMRLVRARIAEIYNKQGALLGNFGIQQQLPMLFVETMNDSLYENVTGQVYGDLDSLDSNSRNHIDKIDSEVRQNVIVDIAEVGFFKESVLVKKAKVLL